MGLPFPNVPPQDGDNETLAPRTNSRSLLGADPITGGTRRIIVDSNHELWVNVKTDPSGVPAFISTINTYSEALVTFDTETTILTYTVPAAETLYISGVVGWGDTDGEFIIKVDGVIKGGGRTTAATPNFIGDYLTAPIIATTGQVVTVQSHHYNPSAKTMKANLMGGIK